MATTLYANNVAAVTAADIGPSDTILILSAGQGSAFPSPNAQQYFWATLIHPVSHVVEIVQCTSRSADTLTIVRGRDGTSATAFPAGSVIEMRLNAEQMREANWRLAVNVAMGVLQLGADGKAAKSLLPSDIVYPVGGVIPLDLMPPELLTELEGDARYGRLDQAETWAENQTFSKNVTINGKLKIGVSSGEIGIGDDVILKDIDRSNTLGIVGGQNANQGNIMFGDPTAGNNGGAILHWGNDTNNFRIQPPAGGDFGIFHGGNFDPNSKVNAQSGIATDIGFRRGGYGATVGIAYWGTNAWIQFDSANFIASHNFYAPNVVATCDLRLKKAIRKHKVVGNIGDMVQLHSWEWRKKRMPHAPAGRHTGPIAQEVRKYAPQHVTELDDGTLGVDKAGLALEVSVDSASRIRALEARVEELSVLVYKLLKNR